MPGPIDRLNDALSGRYRIEREPENDSYLRELVADIEFRSLVSVRAGWERARLVIREELAAKIDRLTDVLHAELR